MKQLLSRGVPALALFAALALIVAGCGQQQKPGDSAKNENKNKPAAENAAGHDHSGWWCDEHGLPEEVCDLCSKKYRDAEKAKGNWCEHNRVKTSCFKCNPGLREKYAAEYKAKFGKEPPPIEDDGK
jgi:hypothetical protein